MGWIQFSSEEELQNALQQDSHVIDGVKVNIFMSYHELCISEVGQKCEMTGIWGDLRMVEVVVECPVLKGLGREIREDPVMVSKHVEYQVVEMAVYLQTRSWNPGFSTYCMTLGQTDLWLSIEIQGVLWIKNILLLVLADSLIRMQP